MAQPGGPEQPREPAAGDGFTDVIRSRAGRTSLLLLFFGGGGSAVRGYESVPLLSVEAVPWKLVQGFGKLLWRRAEEQPGTVTAPPRAWGGRGTTRGASRGGGGRGVVLWEQQTSFSVGSGRYWCSGGRFFFFFF